RPYTLSLHDALPISDLSALSAAEWQVLGKLVAASKVMDALFLRQVWSGNQAMLLDLARAEGPDTRARLHYFLINKGPWDRLDHQDRKSTRLNSSHRT